MALDSTWFIMVKIYTFYLQWDLINRLWNILLTICTSWLWFELWHTYRNMYCFEMKKNTYVKQEFILNSTVPTRPNLTPKQTQTKPRYSYKVYLGFALGLLFENLCPLWVYFGSTRSLICLGFLFSSFLLPIRVYSLCNLGLLWVHSELWIKLCSSKPRVYLKETLEDLRSKPRD